MSTQDSAVDVTFLERRLGELRASDKLVQNATSDGDGGGPHIPDMNERLGKLEGEVGGLKHSQNMTLGGLGLVAALVTIVVAAVVGFGIYELQRIDQLGDKIGTVNDKVNELPGKINADLRDLTKTLADVIIATKQTTQPQQTTSPTPTPQQHH